MLTRRRPVLGSLLMLAAASAAGATAAAEASSPDFADVSWAAPTPFDGKSYAGAASLCVASCLLCFVHLADGMPAGNGRVVVLAWGDPAAGGLSFYVRSPVALHSDSTLFTIARVSVAMSPNPFAGGGYYNQSLHLARGEVAVHGGGSSFATRAASVTLCVRAHALMHFPYGPGRPFDVCISPMDRAAR